ncbi:MAG: hypothetical protein IJV10_06015 [Prevotella sp.]|nr:hypothetical protein [Prevotella sp.]
MMTDIQETNRTNVLFERIAALIEQSRQFVVSAVNVAEVRTRFEVGRFIFEDEQQGERATYGKQVLKNLSIRLTERFGNDWSYDTLKRCRYFYQAYENAVIGATPLPQLGKEEESPKNEIVTNLGNDVATIRLPRFTLSWSHYLIKSGDEVGCLHTHPTRLSPVTMRLREVQVGMWGIITQNFFLHRI